MLMLFAASCNDHQGRQAPHSVLKLSQVGWPSCFQLVSPIQTLIASCCSLQQPAMMIW